MFSTAPTSPRQLIAIGAAILLVAFTAGCKPDEEAQDPGNQSAVTKPTVALPNVDKLTREIQPRDPAVDGDEKERIVIRDGFGRIREIQIKYRMGGQGFLYRDVDGKTTSVKIHLQDGTFNEGKPNADGTALAEFTMSTTDGTVLIRREPFGQGGIKHTMFFQDGKTPQFIETIEGESRTVQFFQENGTPVYETHYSKNFKLSLKLWDPEGKLVYFEERVPLDQQVGGMINVVGSGFDANGKATHKVLLKEGPYDNETGRIFQIDTLAADGSVTLSEQVDYYRKSSTHVGAYESSEALNTDKRQVFQTTNGARRNFVIVETNLSPLVNDKSK